jgi:hypothetical protein
VKKCFTSVTWFEDQRKIKNELFWCKYSTYIF